MVAMLLFVLICCGAATGVAGKAGWEQQVSLTFGLCITCLAYTVGHHSGGQINCAVTFGLVLMKKLEPLQGLVNFVCQMVGSLAGAAILAVIVPPMADKTGSLGTNTIARGEDGTFTAHAHWQALIGEIFMTFLLMYVVLETAVNPRSGASINAPLAIGVAVYLAHSMLIPIDGCSINPTRSFGPPVVASIRYPEKASLFWQDHWVFWVGPLVGSALAVLVYKVVNEMLPGVNSVKSVEAPSEKVAPV